MPGVKTAISLEKSLFDQINKLAKEKHISRSRLFILAVQDYLKKYESRNLLAQINAAYDDISDEEETKIAQVMKQKQKKNIMIDPW